MRRELIQNVLLIIVFVGLAIGWWFRYVMPKHETLTAAHICMSEQGPDARGACLDKASKEYGSRLIVNNV